MFILQLKYITFNYRNPWKHKHKEHINCKPGHRNISIYILNCKPGHRNISFYILNCKPGHRNIIIPLNYSEMNPEIFFKVINIIFYIYIQIETIFSL